MTWSCWSTIACIIVTVATWKQPMTGHVKGWIVNYGGQGVVEANAIYHGYDYKRYREHCGVAAMSPTNLGQTVWIRPAPGTGFGDDPAWYGPCGVFDTAARTDWYHSVIEVAGASAGQGEIIEAPGWLLAQWGIEYGLLGEAYFGDCPPDAGDTAYLFAPPVVFDPERPVRDNAGQIHGHYPPQWKTTGCKAAPQTRKYGHQELRMAFDGS